MKSKSFMAYFNIIALVEVFHFKWLTWELLLFIICMMLSFGQVRTQFVY